MSEAPLRTDCTLYDAVRAIEASHRRLAVVTADDGRLVGTLTDGDVRRCLLAGGTLQSRVDAAMGTNPVIAYTTTSDREIVELLRENNLRALPIVDDDGRYLRIVHLDELVPDEQTVIGADHFKAAVIMAGGEGTRLRPLTERIPKPMVEIAGLPLLERQVHRLAKARIEQLYVSVNYLAHLIEDHFSDGSRFGVSIEYLREKERMGTAGALSLLDNAVDGPLLVINGDVLTTSDFAHLYTYHVEQNAAITVSAINYHVDIPFGVVRTKGTSVVKIEEKPSQQFFCNAGIYALSSTALSLVPPGTSYDMTDLINDCLAARHKVAVFPVHEYWTDIGTPADLARAREVFAEELKDQ